MKRAFTLIELLVVIAIIAILAAILFPVFAQAKAAAKKTAALSNVKQLALANIMYQADNDDYFSFGLGDSWWGDNWVFNTQPYVKSYGLMIDPMDPKSKATWDAWMKDGTAWANETFLPVSFAANGLARNDSGGATKGVMGLAQSWLRSPAAAATAVTKPAETVMLAARHDGQRQYGTGMIFMGFSWWDGPWAGGGNGGLIPDGGNQQANDFDQARTGQPYKSQNGVLFNKSDRDGGVSAIHAGTAPFVFADGHAKAMRPTQTNPDGRNRPTDNMWDAYRQ